MSYTEEEIRQMRERAKQQYEQLKADREKERKRKEDIERMNREEEQKKWKQAVLAETQYFSKEQKAIFEEILKIMGRSIDTVKPSDFEYALQEESPMKYQLIELWNKLFSLPMDMGTMSFTKRYWYDAGAYWIGQEVNSKEYKVHGFGVPAKLILDNEGKPSIIELTVPFKLLKDISLKGHIKVNIPEESKPATTEQVQEKRSFPYLSDFIMRYCLYCGNKTYNGHFYCSKTCKRKMKKLCKQQPKYYFNDKTRKWELINYANNQQKTKGSIYWLNEETPKLNDRAKLPIQNMQSLNE